MIATIRISLICSPSQQEITSIDNIVETCIIMNLTTHLELVLLANFLIL